MTTVFEGSPKFDGISGGGDSARVVAYYDLVLIHAIDVLAGVLSPSP